MSKKDTHEPPGGYASAPEKNPRKYQIRVADETFLMSRWREAILAFLFGTWSGDKKFWERPSIQFGDLKLTLDSKETRLPKKDDRFTLSPEGNGPDLLRMYSGYFGNYSLVIDSSRLEVMDALARFVKDPYLGRVEIVFPNSEHVVFYKKERRGEYGCCRWITL